MTSAPERAGNPRRPLRIAAVDPEMARVYARMSGAERLAVAAGMFESARRMLESHLRSEHPEWEVRRLEAEVARRLSHDAG
jgi:hypothetical protein